VKKFTKRIVIAYKQNLIVKRKILKNHSQILLKTHYSLFFITIRIRQLIYRVKMKKSIIFLTMMFSVPVFGKPKIQNIERAQAPVSRPDNIKNAMTDLGSFIKQFHEEALLENLVENVISGESILEIIKNPGYKDVFASDFFKRFLGNITLNVWKKNTSASPQSIKKLGSFVLTGLQRLEKKEDPKETLTELLQNAINQVIKPKKEASTLAADTGTIFLKEFEEDFQKVITRSTAIFPGLAHKFFTRLEDFKDTVNGITSRAKNKVSEGADVVKSGARWFASPFITFGKAVKNGASSFYSTLTKKETPKKEQETYVRGVNPYQRDERLSNSDYALTESSDDSESDFDNDDFSDRDSISDRSKLSVNKSKHNKPIVWFDKEKSTKNKPTK
jgi:hypothetical protein